VGSEPKAHHFIPVGHLARFATGSSEVPRNARLWVFDKQTNRTRPSKVGKVAFETDLYTMRTPQVSGAEVETFEALADLIAKMSINDRWVETDKAPMEERGLRALRELESLPIGEHRLSEEERVDALAYVALLLTQHPTVMKRRAALIAERFRAAIRPIVGDDPRIPRVFADFDRGSSVLGLIPEQLTLALELNYLAWSVVRWRDAPRLILGDNAVIAQFAGATFGIGDAWTTGGLFIVPISTSSALFIGGFDAGLCRVEERSGDRGRAEVPWLNTLSWVRAGREVYAMDPQDLADSRSALGPIEPRMATPDQIEIRLNLLPGFIRDEHGGISISWPPSVLEYDVAAAFAARFARPKPPR
jgi:Protein of unknown function (DUF4238)